jgi:adhesin transport system outer membrane protein
VQGNAMSLEQAVAQAVDKNPRLLRQYARFQAALNDAEAADGSFLPQIGLRAGIGYEDTHFKTGNLINYDTDHRKEAALTISQLLFNGMRSFAESDRLGHEAEAERLSLLSMSEDLALDVTDAYVRLEQANQLLLLAEQNLQEHQKIYDDTKEKVEKGLASRSDLAQITSRFSSSQSALLTTRRELFDVQTRLVSLVGKLPAITVSPVIDSKLFPDSLDKALNLAYKNHPQIQSAQADIEAVKQELKSANSDFFPELTLDGEIYQNDNVGGFSGNDDGSRLMLNMRYNLFNGFRSTNSAKASGWRLREAHAIKDQALLQVAEQTRLYWNAVLLLKQQEEVLQVNVDAAVATDDGYRKLFDIGRRTLLDVLDAKIEVYLARQNYVRSNYDRVLSEYRLANALGLLMYALRIDYPAQWTGEP